MPDCEKVSNDTTTTTTTTTTSCTSSAGAADHGEESPRVRGHLPRGRKYTTVLHGGGIAVITVTCTRSSFSARNLGRTMGQDCQLGNPRRSALIRTVGAGELASWWTAVDRRTGVTSSLKGWKSCSCSGSC